MRGCKDQAMSAELLAKSDKARRFVEREPIYVEVCERLALGHTLTSICEQLHMPCTSTINEWVREDPDFARAYAQAKNLGWDRIADSCMDIADDASNDGHFNYFWRFCHGHEWNVGGFNCGQ